MSKAQMEISHTGPENGVAVITLSGRVLISTGSDQISATAIRLLDEGARAIIFDLAGVTHLDSTGIGQFIATMTAGLKKNARVVMAAASAHVRESFRVTLLDKVFKFVETVDEAKALVG
jgi:anti-sigma B factor antagonist